MIREQMSDRRMQFLQTTNNDLDNQIVGKLARAAVIRETAASLEVPDMETLSDEDLRAQIKQDEQQAQQER